MPTKYLVRMRTVELDKIKHQQPLHPGILLGLCPPYHALGRFWDTGNEKDEKSERLGGGVALSLTNRVTLTVYNPIWIYLENTGMS